jgi:hypothetical protein
VESPLPALVFDWRRPQSFFQVAMAATLSPRDFYAQMPAGGALSGPILFLVAAHLVPALVAAAFTLSQGLGAALLMFVKSLVPPLFIALSFAALIYAVIQFIVRGSKLSLPQAIGIVCYSSGVQALSFLPWMLSAWAGLLVSLLMMGLIVYLVGVGLRVVAGASKGQALVTMLSSLTIVILAAMWLGFTRSGDKQPPPEAPPAAVAPSTK